MLRATLYPVGMKRIPEGEFFEYPSFSIFLEDLEEIEGIFRAQCESLTIKTPGAEWESVGGLAATERGPLNEVEFVGRSPYVNLEMRPFDSRTYLSDTRDPQQRGIESMVRSVLTRRGRLVRHDRVLIAGWIALAAGSVGVWGLEHPWRWAAFAVGSLTLAAAQLQGSRLRMRSYSLIHLRRAQDRDGFWERNHDQVVVALIGALAGAVLAILGGVAVGLIGA